MRSRMHDDVWSAGYLPPGMDARHARRHTGGYANPVWLCELEDGREVVVKGSAQDSAGMFVAEAEGLAVLAALGKLITPRVLSVGPRSIVLEALDAHLPDADAFWESAGRNIALMHGTTAHE